MLVFLELERRLNVSVRRETFPLINKAKLNNNNKNALLWSQKILTESFKAFVTVCYEFTYARNRNH